MAKKEKKAKVKKTKPAAPKKAKQRERGEGVDFKALLLNHFEKGLLALAVLMTLLLVWSGFGARQGITPDKTPVALHQEVDAAETLVNSYSWEKDFREARVDNQDFPKRADKALRPLDAKVYATNQLLRPPVSPPLTKRKDPDLFAATDLQVRAGFGLLDKASSSRRGPERRSGEQDQEVFSTEELNQEPLDEDSGRPMPGTATFVGDGRGRRSTESEGIYFASVTALVPVRKQLENYQACLANSRGQDESRDVPIYINWILERSETDANGNAIGYAVIAEGQRRRGRRDDAMSRDFRMQAGDRDTLHPDFRHPLLTNDVPAVEVRNPDRLFVHDRIAALSQEQYQKDSAKRSAGRRRRGTGMDRSRVDSSRRMDESRFGEMASDRQQSMGREGRQMYSDRTSGSQQVPETGLRSDMSLDEAPKYFMFRYIDRSVEVGRTYRYRLQLVLDDPNNSQFIKPPPETLEPDVAERVINAKSSVRATAFSAESNPLQILPGQQLLLAEANPAPRTLIRETGQSYQRPGTFPSAKVMALIFDAGRATNVPGTVEVSPGAAVCFHADTEVPLWSRSWLKKEDDFKFRTDFDVLDIRGGDEADKVKIITKPGELLVLDPIGRVRVIREMEDQELVAEYTFPKEEPSRRDGGLDERGNNAGGGRFDGLGRDGGRNAQRRGGGREG